MKAIFYILSVITIFFFASCSKEVMVPTLSSLNVVNAVVNIGPTQVNYLGNNIIYSKYPSITFGAAGEYHLTNTNTQVVIVATSDTLHPIYNKSLATSGGNIYSLFITGRAGAVEDVFIQDKLPSHSDGSCGIRFINLSTGSNPVSVDIKGQQNGSEVASLVYKSITDFKNYATPATISSYIFEFRDANTGNLLTSYTLTGVNNGSPGVNTTANTVRFKNLTIALIGQPAGGTVVQKAVLINNY